MLIYSQVFITALHICLSQAFTTRFIIEPVNKTETFQAKEVQQTEKINDVNINNNKTKKLENISLSKNVILQKENELDPLNLLVAISAQQLITTVQNIPIAGNTYKDTLNMFERVVKELNETTQIIDLTTRYINISSLYMLTILKELGEKGCDVNYLDTKMELIRKHFLKTIKENAVTAVKELNDKSRQESLSSSDIVISFSYHIVSAFQEMTNTVLTLSSETESKCLQPLKSKIDYVPTVFEIEEKHKSIKKYEAQTEDNNKKYNKPMIKIFTNAFKKFNDREKLNTQLSNLSLHGDLSVQYIPLNIFSLFKTSKNEIPNEAHQPKKAASLINTFFESKDQMSDNINNQDLTVEFISPEKLFNEEKTKHTELLQVPEDRNLKYNPFSTISLLKTPKNIAFSGKTVVIGNSKSPMDTFQNMQDKNIINLNNQGLRVGVILPEKDTKSNYLNIKGDTENKVPNNFAKSTTTVSLQPSEIQSLLNTHDRELDDSAVDSLSNVPWPSRESESEPLLKAHTEESTPRMDINIIEMLKTPQDEKLCEQSEPVCGYNEMGGKFIVFLNKCKLDSHNRMHKTSYSPVKMDSCVNLFLQNPRVWAQTFQYPDMKTLHNDVNLRPR